MSGKIAGLLFLGICVLLAALLITKTIPPLVSGYIFAGSLFVLGGLSRGFRRGR